MAEDNHARFANAFYSWLPGFLIPSGFVCTYVFFISLIFLYSFFSLTVRRPSLYKAHICLVQLHDKMHLKIAIGEGVMQNYLESIKNDKRKI